ncbi:hypothetical protein EDEG_02885 [Edhazardia aedis USNM 41457]|uniref:GP-PDE domain-containing protein n=1 Tax=Edhazardia aedis (strain USNM 41457) TaxID=1003232 RepID=J9D4H1_EDHAE|nr:hypothetical protein EDEG_02885 [Edhazardia aedis USNM 41457]|eukprot:EJW02701.1 hypothetical protein EDEG_02885 [Edhazardia aedis USNM 41457]
MSVEDCLKSYEYNKHHLKFVCEDGEEIKRIKIVENGKIEIYIRFVRFDVLEKNILIVKNKKITLSTEIIIITDSSTTNFTLNGILYNLNLKSCEYQFFTAENIDFFVLFIEKNNSKPKTNFLPKRKDDLFKLPLVIGHRGCGQNEYQTEEYVENTVGALTKGYLHGAKWVEFDVNLTKEMIPVIFHDLEKTSNGSKKPICNMTIEEFLNDKQKYTNNDTNVGLKLSDKIKKSPKLQDKNILNQLESKNPNKIAIDNGFNNDKLSQGFFDLKKTNTSVICNVFDEDFIMQNYNTATLEQFFTQTPSELNFNVEIKYISNDSTPLVNNMIERVDRYTRNILDITTKYKREIIFSSFHPEIVIFLSLVQSKHPIFFLFDKFDCVSMTKLATTFCKRYGLAGFITDITNFLNLGSKDTDFVESLHSKDLLFYVYGDLTNEKEVVNMLVDKKVDGIIVDKVNYVLDILHNK